MPDIGTGTTPLRVAIIGSGPSGFYAAEHLLRQCDFIVEIDMFDRLPTPFGLVRGGVAPDHDKIKSVTKRFDAVAATPHFRLYGNVTFGQDVTLDDLRAYYHQIIFAVGAQTDRRMGIPGEDLSGSYAATEFVGWYNGHPDYRELHFDLDQRAATVIGNGNVAMDVVRILARSYDELRKTDIADYALEALGKSHVQDIYLLGRRGPAQASFTPPELKELGEMECAEVIVRPEDAALDPLTQEWLKSNSTSVIDKNLALLADYARREPSGKPKRIHVRFLTSPVEVIGTERMTALKVVKNELFPSSDGSLRPKPTEQYETIEAGLVFRSIGYMGVALPGVPFDEKRAVIPNALGRVLDPATGAPVPGLYAAGWIKRGPSGIIGTNKPDALETVQAMCEDIKAGSVPAGPVQGRDALDAMLRARNVEYVTYQDWQLLDKLEVANGQAVGRPRLKFTRVEDMLNALRAEKARM
ncbi:MAG: FAD-dependent oxidoreductase [Anaerolineae bacterium]|nr:FAD-dependent oxidoreductase [Anaerolineae bacterium]